jgi:hypothetical protein
MTLIQDKQIFFVDSNDRLPGSNSNSDFFYSFDFDKGREFDRVALLQCLIPVSYYMIQAEQNTFILIEGSNQATVTITPGNYNRRSFAVSLTSFLNLASPGGYTYSITFPTVGTEADNGFYTYSVTGNGSVQPIFEIGNYCYEAMGFDANSINNFVSNTLTSTNVIKLKAEDQLYLHSNICSNKNNDILQEIFAFNVPSYGNILFQQFDAESNSKDFVNNQNNIFHFYLTDENDTILNLNGQNITFSIMLFKKNSVWQLLFGSLKYYLLKN